MREGHHGDFSTHERCKTCRRLRRQQDHDSHRRQEIDANTWDLDDEYQVGLLLRTALVLPETLSA